jgi:hypothetical protein
MLSLLPLALAAALALATVPCSRCCPLLSLLPLLLSLLPLALATAGSHVHALLETLDALVLLLDPI